MLFAIAKESGKPGDGNKKLSPSLAKSSIVTQIAWLPPDDR